MTDQHDTSAVESVFNPGKADWVRDQADRELDEDQRALLLALTQLEAEIGRQLSEEELEALEALGDQLEAFDAAEIASAIQQVVSRPADPDRQLSWPELKKKRSG
jgi:hypothetical protein